MNRTPQVVFCLSVALLIPSNSMAWHPLGHAMVGKIAQDLINQDTSREGANARQAVQSLLGEGISLDQIASCADGIKRNKKNESEFCPGPLKDLYDGLRPLSKTSRWHFMTDVTVNGNGGGDGDAGARGQIIQQAKILRGTIPQSAVQTDPKAGQRLALMWLVHLVGDEHQPLHVVHEVEPNGKTDDGADTKPICAASASGRFSCSNGKSLSLHEYWNSLFDKDPNPNPSSGDFDGYVKSLPDQEWAKNLEGKAQTVFLASKPKPGEIYSEEKITALADAGLQESIEAAKDIYSNYHGYEPQWTEKGYSPVHLKDDYPSSMQHIIDDQLADAGARLAAILEWTLGASQSADAPSQALKPPPSIPLPPADRVFSN